MSGSHLVHATCAWAALTAMKSAKSSSQSACAAQKRSNPSRRDAGAALEPIEHSRPERLTVRDHSWEVDGCHRRRPPRRGLRSSVSSPCSIRQIEADQQRIAGERGKALVWRVAVAGRSERQHLPESLAGRGEQVEELDRARRRGRRCRSGPAGRWDGAARRSNEETFCSIGTEAAQVLT